MKLKFSVIFVNINVLMNNWGSFLKGNLLIQAVYHVQVLYTLKSASDHTFLQVKYELCCQWFHHSEKSMQDQNLIYNKLGESIFISDP